MLEHSQDNSIEAKIQAGWSQDEGATANLVAGGPAVPTDLLKLEFN